MSFYAVFNPSQEQLGKAKNLGFPIPEFNSFLGLYYPYWDNFGRWYHIVYPTRENKFRQALASAPYDYPVVLVNNSDYWGVGNYMSHTAIPANNDAYFTYLLLHEMGHFFGLNEEYEGGGRTELEFAPGISEPWSQNISFLENPSYAALKWNQFVNPNIVLPTPDNVWHSSPPVYGAYYGGYGDSQSSRARSHKPGFNCVMESHEQFCSVCAKGILDVVQFSLGISE
ncbi:M64 family metallopeptidase [Legionella sp. km772]|uniref:M64 family metallopeptidase n=1 Tax=Legionella sp. km772 TaxID=2498111 RepID=UPI00268C54AC